jgi:radical SAM superfamily enzyme YgiQ (UPF0313 family)
MKNTRILFITPPYYSLRDLKPGPIYSLGVLYLAGYLRTHGFESRVVISDILTKIKPKVYIPMRLYFKKWKKYKENVEHQTHPVWKAIESIIREYSPKIVGISSNSPAIDSAYKVASIIKKVNPGVYTVMGGFHGTFCPEEVLANPAIDFVIRGEGEIPLLRFVQEIENKRFLWEDIPSLSYRKENSTIKHNQLSEQITNLDGIPFPARDMIILPENTKLKEHTILATRGCVYNCSFCCDKKFWGKIRSRSKDNIVNEIETILEGFPKTQKIYFNDGTLTSDKLFLKELCDEIARRNIKTKFYCTARFDNIDEEILNCLKRAGFQGLYMGAESGDVEILKSMNKRIKLDQIQKSLHLIKKTGIQTLVSILIGVPGETEQSLKNTIQLMKEVEADAFDINCYVPLPGSDWYEQIPDHIKKELNWLEIGYKSNNPFLFKIEGKHDLLKYIEEINKIADRRLMKTIGKSLLNRLLSPYFHLFK